MMRNIPIRVLFSAMTLLFLTSLPSSAAFSATLKAEGNETKISYMYPSTSHDSEAEVQAEVESWAEALLSQQIQEPGNSVILQVQMQGHGQMQMEQSSDELAQLKVFFDIIDGLTKKELTEFCEDGLYIIEIIENLVAKCDPSELKERWMMYFDEESGKALDNAPRDLAMAILDEMMENPTRMMQFRFLSEEENALFEEDSQGFMDKMKEEVEEHDLERWRSMLLNEELSFLIFALKRMEAADLHNYIDFLLHKSRLLLKAIKPLNPKKRNFDIKLVRVVLKHLLSPQDYAAISMQIPYLVKQFRNEQNKHNPLVAMGT